MNTQDQEQIAEVSSQAQTRTLTLENPIKRGETAFSSVTIRKPFGPALRGLSLNKMLTETDHDTFLSLIPRITSPMITAQDIQSGALDGFDLVKIIGEITYFFLPKAERARIDASQTE